MSSSIDGINYNNTSSSSSTDLNNIITSLQPLVNGLDLGSIQTPFDSLYVDNIYLSSLTNNKMIVSGENKLIENDKIIITNNTFHGYNNNINFDSNICLNRNTLFLSQIDGIDQYHYIRIESVINDITIDGPILAGYAGCALVSTSDGVKLALYVQGNNVHCQNDLYVTNCRCLQTLVTDFYHPE